MTQPAIAKKSVQLSGVVVAESSVSSIDPDAGILMYRGYDIADLAEHATYEDTAYLLLHAELPGPGEREAFARELAQRELPDAAARAIDRSAVAASPMDLLRTAASTLSFGAAGQGATDREAGLAAATRLIARLPTAIARHHRRRQGLEPVDPDPSLSYSENFLTMLSGERPSERAARIFDV
ncbi:MAG: citrate synthase, partial [Gaiellaceae bacterium]|nr:citrate synthase [Gaiellaceae bacterium]